MSAQGLLYNKRGDEPFKQVEGLENVKEIQACNDYYAVLTKDNRIFTMIESPNQQFMEIENSFSKNVNFKQLMIGSDFGHLIDQEMNLYGWGNNKNGELGTSDSFPRQKLSQVRIFNEYKQYMRCIKCFAGHSHVLGIFESNISPNGIGHDSQKNNMRSISVGSNGSYSCNEIKRSSVDNNHTPKAMYGFS